MKQGKNLPISSIYVRYVTFDLFDGQYKKKREEQPYRVVRRSKKNNHKLQFSDVSLFCCVFRDLLKALRS